MQEENQQPNITPISTPPSMDQGPQLQYKPEPEMSLQPAPMMPKMDSDMVKPKKMGMKMDKNMIIIGVAILIILVTGVLVLLNMGLGGFSFGLMSKDAVAKKAIAYLNSSVLQPGQTATLGTVTTESGVIKMEINIAGNSYDSYVTRDGKLLFPQAYNVTSTDTTGSNDQGSGTVDASKVDTTNEPYVGQQNAKVVMAYWYDYQCPFCKKNNEEVMKQLVQEYVNTGKMKVIFKDYAFLGSDSTAAGLAEHAVWEAAPAKFYQWHEAMFAKQDAENGGWGNKADILALTASLGIDSAKVNQLMTQKAAEYQKEMDDDKAEGTKFGVNGTPGFIIGTKLISGAQPYDTFKAAIDEALAK